MIPLFNGVEPGRQRRMNLGGQSTAVSHAEILRQAQADREARLRQRRLQDAAIRIQSWWRGHATRLKLGTTLKQRFDEDPSGIQAMRCLYLLRSDRERLFVWVRHAATLELSQGSNRDTWLTLVGPLTAELLTSLSSNADQQHAEVGLAFIYGLLTSTNIDEQTKRKYASYLLNRAYYFHLRQICETIPIEARSTSSALVSLASLFVVPFSIFDSNSEIYSTSLLHLVQYILTIPRLPNRFPVTALSYFSARLPLHMFHLLQPGLQQLVASIDSSGKTHLLANIALFMVPRLRTLMSEQTIDTYLHFLQLLLKDIPRTVFESVPSDISVSPWVQGAEEEDDDSQQPDFSSASGAGFAVGDSIDSRTRTRLHSLFSSKHVNSLLAVTTSFPGVRVRLYAFFMELYATWPMCRTEVLTTIFTGTNGGLVRELYREFVRSSPLGRYDKGTVDTLFLTDPDQTSTWLALIFLTDLYSQALYTMADNEFFASPGLKSPSTSDMMLRNPLMIDEVISLSRKLLTIVVPLYKIDFLMCSKHLPDTSITWFNARDKITRLLQSIHARDSRRPFTPPGHWLISSLDVDSFVVAALAEEQLLSNESEADTLFQIKHLKSTRRLALAPHLSVLNKIPFAIPFETRVQIFRAFVERDMVATGGSSERFHRAFAPSGTRVVIRRDHVSQDGFDKLGNVNMKGLIKITFVNQFGEEEAGIDGGGVFKEFFTSLCKEVFDTDRGLWMATKNNELYPSPHSYAKESHSISWYRFIGRILGKALYEGILVDVAFAGFFLAKWLERQSYLDDLASLDPELYNGLLFLKNYQGNPEDLSLTFAVVEEEFGITKTVELIPDGANIAVTRENRLQYIYRICYYHLTKQIQQQSRAFFEGLSEVIDPKWIRMFNQQELQIMIGGVNSPIDLENLRMNTNYGGMYSMEDPTIKMFWKVANTFDHDQRRALLRFVTSCSRPPLLGFKELQPKFSIGDAGTDVQRLPTASTCVNLLKLPRYTNERMLRAKLLQAITAGAGFDLS